MTDIITVNYECSRSARSMATVNTAGERASLSHQTASPSSLLSVPPFALVAAETGKRFSPVWSSVAPGSMCHAHQLAQRTSRWPPKEGAAGWKDGRKGGRGV